MEQILGNGQAKEHLNCDYVKHTHKITVGIEVKHITVFVSNFVSYLSLTTFVVHRYVFRL